MRKVSLEMNLGKKSQARFPRRIQNNIKLKLVAPALQAEPLPPLGPALTVYGVNARDFCPDFNHNTKDYDTGFPVSINVWVTSTKNYFYEFKSPSCYNLFHRCFNFYEGNDLNLRNQFLLLLALNISLIKNVENPNIFEQKMINNVKQVLGTLRSYGFAFKQLKQKTKSNNFYRKKSYIFGTKFTRKKL